jgi:hypothetical protein
MTRQVRRAVKGPLARVLHRAHRPQHKSVRMQA